jgi:hypothetical protein
MILEPNELLDIENLLKALRRASFKEFSGNEALALARAYALLLDALTNAKKPKPEIKKGKK